MAQVIEVQPMTDKEPKKAISTDNHDWIEAFEGFLSEQVHLAEMANRNHPCGITADRFSAMKLMLETFRWHKSKAARNKSCITDPRSRFDRLVRFIEEVKQDPLNHYGVVQQTAFEVCRVILKYADHIRKQTNTDCD